jgi:hypothetical protein
MKTQRRNKISEATQFKVTYVDCDGTAELMLRQRTFKTIKVMEQWIVRNSIYFNRLMINKYALIDDGWEAFTTIGRKTITLSELKLIVKNLGNEDLKPSKN